MRFYEKRNRLFRTRYYHTKDGLKPNPDKVDVIQKVELPRTEKQLKSFLGLTGYYRKFIRDYAKVAQPLTKFLKKGTKVMR